MNERKKGCMDQQKVELLLTSIRAIEMSHAIRLIEACKELQAETDHDEILAILEDMRFYADYYAESTHTIQTMVAKLEEMARQAA